MDGMMKMFMDEDPELFDIEQCKAHDMWPKEYLPSEEIIPYVRRLGPSLQAVQVGIFKGETTYRFLTECPNIKFMYGINIFDSEAEREIAKRNLKDFEYLERFATDPIYSMSQPYSLDFVFIDSKRYFRETLEKYYSRLKKNGIIAGSEYNLAEVRQTINEFRSQFNAMRPVNVTKKNDAWFWYK